MRRSLVATALAATATVTALGVAGPAQATIYGSHDVHGSIEQEYLARGGPNGFLGLPRTNEKTTSDGAGRYNNFQGGAIYWSPNSGAHEIHGPIRSRWNGLAAQAGVLGYPTSEQRNTPRVTGQYNLFQAGAIYSSPTSGTHEVYGAIFQAWAAAGYEASDLGFPVSGEKAAVDNGRRSNFEHGYIVYRPATGAVVHLYQ